MPLAISSNDFSNGGPIPAAYTCDGDDKSPHLKWDRVPANAKSLALIVDDPDAPDPNAPTRVWVHWVLYNIPAHIRELPDGIAPEQLPAGTLQGTNDWGRLGYGGPCPPIGRHRYFFKLFALDSVLPDLRGPTRAQLEKAMMGHVMQKVEIIGTYQRPK